MRLLTRLLGVFAVCSANPLLSLFSKAKSLALGKEYRHYRPTAGSQYCPGSGQCGRGRSPWTQGLVARQGDRDGKLPRMAPPRQR